MKVAIDISPLKSSHQFRGIGSYTRNLTNALKKITAPGFSFDLIESGQIPNDCDLVHYPYFDIFFLTLPSKFLRPTIITVHDLIPLKYPAHFPPGLRGKIRWLIQKRRLKKAQVIITDSKVWQKEIAQLVGYPVDKIYPIPLAAGEEFRVTKDSKLKEKVRNKYHLPLKFILYTGHANWNKNISSLAKACETLKIPLVIIGLPTLDTFDQNHPENQPTIELLNKFDRKPWFINLGFVPLEDLVVIYNLATVYCQPSFDEGFGLPVLEAMASGCPVVSSNKGSLPEVTGKAAILVSPDPKNIAEGIKKLLNDENLRIKLIKEGFLQAKKFSWGKTARQTLEIYKKISEENRF